MLFTRWMCRFYQVRLIEEQKKFVHVMDQGKIKLSRINNIIHQNKITGMCLSPRSSQPIRSPHDSPSKPLQGQIRRNSDENPRKWPSAEIQIQFVEFVGIKIHQTHN